MVYVKSQEEMSYFAAVILTFKKLWAVSHNLLFPSLGRNILRNCCRKK